jgi:hypothetical protein
MRIRALRTGALLAFAASACLTAPAEAGISSVVFRLTASNAGGAGFVDVRFADGVWNPQTGDFTWAQSTPVTIHDTNNGQPIATLRNAALLLADEQRIDLTLTVQSGASLTRFDVQSAQLLFTTIPAGDADARASGAIGVTDTNGNGATIISPGSPGTGIFQGRFNGLYPAGGLFASLCYQVSVGPGGTGSLFQTRPARIGV